MFPAYLWGIETKKRNIRGEKKWTFPAYLWGIETIKAHYLAVYLAMFPAYLWGIETVKFVDGLNVEDSSQPTYEELKQKMTKAKELQALSSQPTYEELKRTPVTC